MRRTLSLNQLQERRTRLQDVAMDSEDLYSPATFDRGVIELLNVLDMTTTSEAQRGPLQLRALNAHRTPSQYTDRHPSFVLQTPMQGRTRTRRRARQQAPKQLQYWQPKRFGRLDEAPDWTLDRQRNERKTRKTKTMLSKHLQLAHTWQHYPV